MITERALSAMSMTQLTPLEILRMILVAVKMKVLILLLVCCLAQGRERLDPLVDTSQGLIRGLKADDGDYSMFLGIPFAKVDADNPFGVSYPYPIFDEVFEAYDDSAICPQVDDFTDVIVGTVDCLHLNIYVPNKASSTNRIPVLVWIYGGAFEKGYANRFIYGPKFLIRHDVILVTLNYRVGPYGFFCLETPQIPGNQGLKDQVLGLRWVRDNIASFGGDVSKITLMGESAGAASIDYHLYSNTEKLFNQAIMQTGTALSPLSIQDPDPNRPLKIAEHLGLATEDLSEALNFLSNTDVKLVIAASKELGIVYKPCVEKVFEGVNNIITEHPLNLDLPKIKTIPVLAGFNSKEELITYINQPEDFYKNLNVINELLNLAFDYDREFFAMEDIVRHFYLGDEEESEATKYNLSDFQSDYRYNYPVQKSLKKYIQNGATKVYQYMFSYSGERNFVKKRLNITEDGAVHADEISYLFDLSYDKDQMTEADQRMIDQITTLWTNFVKYGDPTPEVTELVPVKWTPITTDTINFLNIGKELKMEKRPFYRRLTFWELFYMANKDHLKAHREN